MVPNRKNNIRIHFERGPNMAKIIPGSLRVLDQDCQTYNTSDHKFYNIDCLHSYLISNIFSSDFFHLLLLLFSIIAEYLSFSIYIAEYITITKYKCQHKNVKNKCQIPDLSYYGSTQTSPQIKTYLSTDQHRT